MDEYNKLIQEWSKITNSYYNDELPKINDAKFICMLGSKFLYSNDESYTYGEMLDELYSQDSGLLEWEDIYYN